jgi:hypothetical protein
MDKDWLPSGKHWGLTITHYRTPPTGPLLPDCGHKLIWHTTEGSYSSALGIFRTGHDAPHVLIDPHGGRVAQFLPFSDFSKALEHPTGTPETNRAGCVQVEIAGNASDSDDWEQAVYNRLGALVCLIEHRVAIPRRARHPFTATPSHQARRLSPRGFIAAAGHLGHEHAPSQRDQHWDPGCFRTSKLFAGCREATREYS